MKGNAFSSRPAPAIASTNTRIEHAWLAEAARKTRGLQTALNLTSQHEPDPAATPRSETERGGNTLLVADGPLGGWR